MTAAVSCRELHWHSPPVQAACYAIQNGATLSRAQVRFFKHNDMADLERLLQEQADKDKRSK